MAVGVSDRVYLQRKIKAANLLFSNEHLDPREGVESENFLQNVQREDLSRRTLREAQL
jgi:hypothetical protein